jgi:hypothetical protein
MRDNQVEQFMRSTVGSAGELWVGQEWITVELTVPAPLVDSGWKLHISSRTATYMRLLETVVPLLVDKGWYFKVAASLGFLDRINGGVDYPASVGKALTVYPDPSRVVEVGQTLVQALQGFEGPEVLSDRQISPSAPVYYRFGPFRANHSATDDKGATTRITGPDGVSFEGAATLRYAEPTWASDPFAAARHFTEHTSPHGEPSADAAQDEPVENLLGGRYLVVEAGSAVRRRAERLRRTHPAPQRAPHPRTPRRGGRLPTLRRPLPLRQGRVRHRQ